MSKILILDDDSDAGSLLKLILVLHGFLCEYITKVEDLNEKIFTFTPDILIIDIFLGNADGRKICKQLKENKETAHIPVILCSADRDASKDFKNYKAEAFIPKPFEHNEFIQAVEMVK